MPLSDEQRAAIVRVAKAEGVDPKELADAASAIVDGDGDEPSDSKEPAAPDTASKLYMYLLPFVRVREVRAKWLGLDEAFPGDDQVASDWAAAHVGATPSPGDRGGDGETS